MWDICYKIVNYLRNTSLLNVSPVVYLLNLVALCGMWETLTKSPGLPPHKGVYTWALTSGIILRPADGGERGMSEGTGAVCLPTIPSHLGVGWASPFSQQEDTIISILQVGRLRLGGFWDCSMSQTFLPKASLLPLAWVPTYLYWRWVSNRFWAPRAHQQVQEMKPPGRWGQSGSTGARPDHPAGCTILSAAKSCWDLGHYQAAERSMKGPPPTPAGRNISLDTPARRTSPQGRAPTSWAQEGSQPLEQTGDCLLGSQRWDPGLLWVLGAGGNVRPAYFWVLQFSFSGMIKPGTQAPGVFAPSLSSHV